jgi:hypothetical protein
MVESQFVTECRYCGSKFYVHQDIPPAVVLKPQIDKTKARNLVLNELRDKEVAVGFLKSSFYEGAELYYIPFFEVRGIKTGYSSSEPGQPQEYNYVAYDYVEKANDLSDLALDYFDYAIVEDAITSAEQAPFSPVEMRKTGVVIPPQHIHSLVKKEEPQSREVVENYHRLVYFPVWEVSYTYKGILFKSYVSAIDGRSLKIQGLRSHKKKLKLSMLGLLCLAVIFGRGMNAGGGALMLMALLSIPIAAVLFPYLWELFAFQEIVEKRGGLVLYETINYTENMFIKFSRKTVEGFTKLMGVHDEEEYEDEDDDGH